MLVEQILRAKHRVVLVAPGVSEHVAKALVDARRDSVSVTVIIDADEDVCRIGYGDVKGFEHLKNHAGTLELRKHSGMRLGLLLTDKTVMVWTPTPRSVDSERALHQPNAIVLDGGQSEEHTPGESSDEHLQSTRTAATVLEGTARGIESLADRLVEHLKHEQVGAERVQQGELQQVVRELRENPPAPFDLARKVRVFSTRFQYVEAELKGAEWTDRRVNVSSLLLNSDLPEGLQDVLETQVRPYRAKGDIAIDVPHLVGGRIAYDRHGEKMLVPATQRDMESAWKDIKARYLSRIPGFGTLIKKRDLGSFREEADAFECVLRTWVTAFRQQVKNDEDQLVTDIVESIQGRIAHSDRRDELGSIDLDRLVRKGLERMRVIDPRVRIVIKDVSWESSRDREFSTALRKALPPKDLKGWFEEFTAAQEKR